MRDRAFYISRAIRGFLSLLIFGQVFKIMHWPGAGIFELIGALGLAVAYGMQFFDLSKRKVLDTMRFIAVLILLFNVLLRAFNLVPTYQVAVDFGVYLMLALLGFAEAFVWYTRRRDGRREDLLDDELIQKRTPSK
ncbi:MAG: hypothetical protein AAF740_00805 [Bacteroidota bacterium]